MKEKKIEKFIIIDGNAIIHRAYHALPPLTTKDGSMVNAVYGFASMLLKIKNDLKPDYLAVSFDVAGGTFRDEVYKDYKATRVKADEELYNQIPLVHDLVRTFDIPIYTKQGFEADDVIATIIKKVEKNKKNIKNIIVTGDKDLLQLVSPKTNVYLLKKGLSDYALYDEVKVLEDFNFKPKNIIDYKAFRGDPSDNIPGIKGIGDKTAKDLITKIGDINKIYQELEKEDSNLYKNFSKAVIEKIKNDRENAFLSASLATIKDDVPEVNFDLKKSEEKELDKEKIIKFLQKFEFFSLIKRIPGYETKKENKKYIKKELIIVDQANEKVFLEEIAKNNFFACREIINNEKLTELVFSTKEKNFYVKKINSNILKIFLDNKKTIIGHDIKNLIKFLDKENIKLENKIFDIMIASYILNSSTRAHDIKTIAFREIGLELKEMDSQTSLFGVDPTILKEETETCILIFEIYKQKLEDMENLGLFDEIEMKLIPVLAEMENNGVKIDELLLKKLSEEVNLEIKNLTEKIWQEAGEEFNISSSVQLRDILFEKMDLPTFNIKKGKTGYSTAASELEKLYQTHPIIAFIENYRELEKLRNTYIDVLPNLVNKETGRIHTTFNQAITTTGRLSSSEPNIQNIPIKTELGRKVREAFVAEKGNKLIVADYSQIELRIVASLAEDKKMLEIFEKDLDIHKATAAKINGVDIEKVSKEMRNSAKAINFGVLYGMGSFGLAQRTGMTNYEAQNFIKKYFETFSQVKIYLENTIKEARRVGYVETLFGRRRYIPELKSPNKQIKNSGERMAINMPVQGTAADIMKMAMINFYKTIEKENLKKDVKMILQVHDELVVECKEALAEKIAVLLKKEMETVTKLRVKIKVDVGIGDSWGKIK
jgi:DNA polymerase-1